MNDYSKSVISEIQKLSEGDTLFLGGGELHFYPENCYERHYCISNNDLGNKKIAFPIIDKKNITIDGQGAKLIFHGEVLPFVIDQSENVTIRNLSIDYAEPGYFAARIVDSGDDFVEMEYDAAMYHCDVLEGQNRMWGENWEHFTNCMFVNEFDPDYKGPVPTTPTYFACIGGGSAGDFQDDIRRRVFFEKIGDNRLRMTGNVGYRHVVGKYWLSTYCGRICPGVFCNDSKNIQIIDVHIVHALAMGVICQLCENVTLDGVVVKAGEGRLLSTNADATHFVNCSGLVHIKNCVFENMLDDAGNIHGMYLPIVEKQSTNRLLLRFGHGQQRGINIFKSGDAVRIVDHKTLQPIQNLTVKNSTLLSLEQVLLEIVEDLPEHILEGWVVENQSRMPAVHIEGCRTGYNRPRGFLLSTNKDALVENCVFYNLNWAISLPGDALDWFESGASGKVVIRNNRFDNASYAGDPVIRTQDRIHTNVGQAYHESLIIENNYFRTNGRRFMAVSNIGTVVFRNNTFCQDDSLYGGTDLINDGFDLRHCRNIEIEKI